MQLHRREPRKRRERGLPRRQDPEHDDRGQQQQGRHAAAAHQVPDGVAAHRQSSSSGQPAIPTTLPSRRTRRAASPDRSSHSGAASPSTIAAVLAAFASTHVAAATLAVLQISGAGCPVRGSTMWWRSTPPLRHRRIVVLEVARPPSRKAIFGPSPSQVAMVVAHAYRPAARRRVARDRDVAAEADQDAAPRLRSDPSRGAVGCERLPGRPEVELDACGNADRVTCLVEHDATPAGAASQRARRCRSSSTATSAKSRV